MSMANPQYVSSSPSYDSSLAWEKNYQQRARTMTRDYVNPNSTRLSHRRSRSADSRIQYYRSLQQPSYRDGTGPSDYRMGCINMLYPTQDESRATLSYDTGAPTYHSKLPRPSGNYVCESERAGRSLSPPAYRPRKQGSNASTGRAPSGIVDPYEMTSSPGRNNLQNYEYLRNSLIMFGGEDQHSDGTGLSQEELLSRKHRDDAAARRLERRNRNSPSRNRVVNLPPSLQTPHANRQQQQRSLQSVPPPGSFPSATRQMSPYGQSPEPSVYQTSSYGSGNNNSPLYQHQYDPSAPQTPSRPGRAAQRGPSSPDPPARSEWNTTETTETAHTPGTKGWRTSMVQRIRSQSSSSGRKWNIIPSLSRSRSVSPGRQPVDPVGPRYSATEFATTLQQGTDVDSEFAVIPPKRSRDPPQVSLSRSRSSDYSASSQVTYPTENGGHREYASSSVGGSLDEDLDVRHMAAQYLRTGREMVRKSAGSPQMSRSRSAERSYTSASRAASQSSTARQSGGVASRNSHSSATGVATPRYKMEPKNYAKINARAWVAQGNNVSMQSNNVSVSTAQSSATPRQPSQSMDRFISSPLNNPPGLNMGDFVTSASLAYNAATPQKQKVAGQTKTSPTSVMDMEGINPQWDSSSKSSPSRSTTSTSERPKSILRRRNRGLLMECPSDETPTHAKIVRISDKPVSRGQFISENPSAMGFVDHHGRALSPILNGSFDMDPSAQEKTTQPMTSQSIPTFEKNIPVQFQQAFIADNGAVRADDQSGQISDEYTAFIESVASVVVQTAVRQFLAKLTVKRMRAMSARKKSSRPPRTRPMQNRHLEYRHKIGALNRPRGPPPVLDIAATQIQSLFRGWYARDCIAVDNYCAIIIQKVFRGHLRRRKYLYDRYRVIQVQSLARKRLAYDNFATCMYCVVAIQAAMRGYLVRQRRSQNRVMTQYVHRAATTIQAQWRSFQCEMAFLRAYEHILVVQSVARGWVTRRLIRSWLRAHNIKVSSSLLGLQSRATKPKVATNYKLPQGYNNHTAFMKMNVPQPIDNRNRPGGKTGLVKGLSNSFENRSDSRSRGIRMNKSDTDGTGIPMPSPAFSYTPSQKAPLATTNAPSWRAKSKWEVNQRPSVEPVPKEPETPVEDHAQEVEDEEVEKPNMWRSALRSTGTTPPWQLENVKKDSHSSRLPLQTKESTESKPVIAHAKSCESETGAPSDEGGWRSEGRSNSVGRRISSSHEFFRNKRSDNEQARLDQIHGTFTGVGLMGGPQPSDNQYGSKLGRSMSDEKKDDTGATYSSPPPSESGGGVKSVARMFGAPVASFGSRGSFENKDAMDMRNRESLAQTVSTVSTPSKRKSTIHAEMRSKRSESEQQRLDDMMQTFAKVGLLGRTKN